MTSAAELFYTRRSRFGRSTADELGGLQPLSLDRNPHNNNTYSHAQNRRHHRHLPNTNAGSANHRPDFDACDPLRRSASHGRHNCHRVSHQDRSALQLDEGTSQFVSSDRINLENFSSGSRPRLTGNERLPGAVLLARARLLERLRGVPASGSRPRSGGRFHIFGAEIVLDDDYSRPVEARNRRTENLTGGSSANGFLSADSSSETERLGLSQEPNKKPDGLTQETLDCLHLELFSSTELAVKELVSRASLECSICLESFVQGDELIRLPCGHRFHAVCLDPWVRIRGDCPYCRSVIVVTSQSAESST